MAWAAPFAGSGAYRSSAFQYRCCLSGSARNIRSLWGVTVSHLQSAGCRRTILQEVSGFVTSCEHGTNDVWHPTCFHGLTMHRRFSTLGSMCFFLLAIAATTMASPEPPANTSKRSVTSLQDACASTVTLAALSAHTGDDAQGSGQTIHTQQKGHLPQFNFWKALGAGILVIGGLLGLNAWVRHRGRFLTSIPRTRQVHIVERLAVDPRKHLLLVEVSGQRILIGVSSDSMQSLLVLGPECSSGETSGFSPRDNSHRSQEAPSS